MRQDDDPSTKARKLVKQLHEATASAEDLAKTVAEGIRRERTAGLPYKPAWDSFSEAKPKQKRTAHKKR